MRTANSDRSTPDDAANGAGESEAAERSRRERLGFSVDISFVRESALVIAIVAVLATWIYRLYDVRWRVPFSYNGDGLSNDAYAKAMSENGWFLHPSRLGAPFTADWRDFPLGGENIHYLSEKVLGIISGNWATGLDVYFVLGFFLIALSAYFTARYLRFRVATSLIIGVLYAFLPYHAYRGSGHLQRGEYYIVPVAILLLVWVAYYRTEFLRLDGEVTRFRRGRLAAAVVIGLLLGASDTQNAMFMVSILAVIVVLAAMRDRDWRPLAVGALLVVATFGSLGVNNLPFVIARHERGANTQAGKRALTDQDHYALHIVRLILPAAGHRFSLFRRLTAKAARGSLTDTEASGTALGLVGSVGFLWSIGLALAIAGRRRGPTSRFVSQLGVINMIAVLIAAIGGFAFLIAVAGVLQYRTWNRISTFIAFASLLAAGVLFERLFAAIARWVRNPRVALGTIAALVAIVLVGGVLDQTPPADIPAYAATASSFKRDANFYQGVEHALPRNAMVFQLPIAVFPEQGPILQMPDYAEFTAYVQTSHLRWSYGAMRGRPESNWQLELRAADPTTVLATVAAVGFDGVVLDTRAFADQGAAILAAAKPLVGAPKLESANGTLYFLDLRPLQATLRSDLGPAVVAKSAAFALHGFEQWQGFSFPEQTCTDYWRWAVKQTASLNESNPTSTTSHVALSTKVQANPAATSITVSGPGFHDVVPLTNGAGTWSRTVALPPGKSRIEFALTGPPFPAPHDSRPLQFNLVDYSFGPAVLSPLAAWVGDRQQAACRAG